MRLSWLCLGNWTVLSNPFALLCHSHLFSVTNSQSVGTKQLVKCLLSGISISWETPAVDPIETFLHSINFQYWKGSRKMSKSLNQIKVYPLINHIYQQDIEDRQIITHTWIYILIYLTIYYHRRLDRRKCIQDFIPLVALNPYFSDCDFPLLVSDNPSFYVSHMSFCENAARSGVLGPNLKDWTSATWAQNLIPFYFPKALLHTEPEE